MGSLSRQPWLDYTDNRFWIEAGTIAMQVGPVQRKTRPNTVFEMDGDKDVVPLLMQDGTKAFAVCAPGGWEPWVEEL